MAFRIVVDRASGTWMNLGNCAEIVLDDESLDTFADASDLERIEWARRIGKPIRSQPMPVENLRRLAKLWLDANVSPDGAA